jgi:primosomal protein N' (replication factor Y) (superfamily II helicase)
MIADVVFDVPVDRPFTYRVPEGWSLASGQRVLAPLRGTLRTGVVVALRADTGERLKHLERAAEGAPILKSSQLALARWIAAESLSSLGSTLAALTVVTLEGARRPLQTSPSALGATPAPQTSRFAPGFSATSEGHHDWAPVELLVGTGRERRVLERIADVRGPVLVLAADLDGCVRWWQRLGKIERTVRLDSGATDAERAEGWRDLSHGAVRLAVGTRSALLAPLPPGGTVVVIDEHENAHRPPGPPRIHARDVVLERVRREGLTALFSSPTPSAEMWQRAVTGAATLRAAASAAWPVIALADTRGILRREALTPALAREIREALAAGRRVFLGASRLASAVACDECGGVMRCAACGIALAYSRASVTLVCRLCAAATPLPDLCPACRGHRLSPFGWGVERIEHAVRRRFPKARVARYDPEATRGARAEAQREGAAAAEIVIGTRGALRLFGPGSLGLAAFVSPDQLLHLPDFRAGERTLALLWAAAERVRPDGRMVIQSQNPSHYVFEAVVRQNLAEFYQRELQFRRELGYPPFRRLAVVTVRGRTSEQSQQVADEVVTALRGASNLTVYPPPSVGARGRSRQVVIKGDQDLPSVLKSALGEFLPPALPARGIMDVEVDPIEWPF